MKGSEIKRLLKDLLKENPELRMRGSLLFRTPVDLVLTGVSFDTSGFDRWAVERNAFFQPMYDPKEDVVLGWSRDAESRPWYEGRSDWYDLEPEKGIDATIRLLAKVKGDLRWMAERSTPEGILPRIEQYLSQFRENFDQIRQLGFTYLLLNRFEEAEAALVESRQVHDNAGGKPQTWSIERANRGDLILSMLRDDPTKAQEQLKLWAEETKASLKVSS